MWKFSLAERRSFTVKPELYAQFFYIFDSAFERGIYKFGNGFQVNLDEIDSFGNRVHGLSWDSCVLHGFLVASLFCDSENSTGDSDLNWQSNHHGTPSENPGTPNFDFKNAATRRNSGPVTGW